MVEFEFMSAKCGQFWKNLKKCRDDAAFIFRLTGYLRKAPKAMDHLLTVTRKRGIHNIRPLEEKRWDEKCMKSWQVLSNICIMLEEGRYPEDVLDDFLKYYKPIDAPFMKYKTAKWKKGTGCDEVTDKITLKLPDLSGKWKSISASKASKLMRKKK